jgi:hypothetical protein
MHLIRNSLIAFFFVAAAGCAGSTPTAKTSDGGPGTSESAPPDEGSADGKQAECNMIKAQFDAMDDAAKGAKGAAIGRKLSPALEKMAKTFRQSPPKTPGLDKATAELVTEADALTVKLKELEAAFAEMEKVNEDLKGWQANVEKSAEEFDRACSKADKAECESMSKRVTQVPELEGDQFGKYANDLERFVRSMEMYEVSNVGLRTAWKKMLSVLGDGVKPMRRLGELLEEPKKLDPAASKLKSKLNQVREICGLPVRQ